MVFLHVTTDCARYNVDQVVSISVKGPAVAGGRLIITCFSCGRELGSTPAPGVWSGSATIAWRPPQEDGKGYLAIAEVRAKDGSVALRGSCGIDVNSNWLRYPRYGYLSHFGPELAAHAGTIVEALKDFHLNGLQFYDWQWRHHHPLSGESQWHDIANRVNSRETIQAFISEAHRRNMACMAYNLGYGAVDGCFEDGVRQEWALFDDANATHPYHLTMPDGWGTKNLNIFDPGNADWRRFLFKRQAEAQAALGFDGWHMDQLGNPGQKFTKGGEAVRVDERYSVLLNDAKRHVPGALIFNNVGGYGLTEARDSTTDAMYAEMWEWEGQKTYSDIQNVIDRSRSGGKPSIVSAYMNYDRAKQNEGKAQPGDFNLSGVLLTDAAILASGGNHIELGDGQYMLDHEYFPNRNLVPSKDLLSRLKTYYDFAVAYEELLTAREIQPCTAESSIEDLPYSRDSEAGKIWTFARTDGRRTIVHLVNLLSAKDALWRDANGQRQPPQIVTNMKVRLPNGFSGIAWAASPDDGIGTATPLTIVKGSAVVPRLEYWTMIVLEPLTRAHSD